MPINILMPALSPTMEKGNLAKWHVKEGDSVAPGDVIAEIETDKATMEVEAVDEGRVGKILVPEGSEDVPVNEVIALLLGEDEDESASGSSEMKTPARADKPEEPPASAARTPAQEARKEPSQERPAPAANSAPASARGDGERIFASPLARRLARERGVDLAAVPGSGPHGRIVMRDIERAPAAGPAKPEAAPVSAPAAAATPTAPSMTDDQIRAVFEPGSFEEKPHDGMRRTIARRLVTVQQEVPVFYLTVDMALDALLKLRADLNAAASQGDDGKPVYRLSVNDFLIKAMALALKAKPMANATWTENARLLHRHADIGVAVAVEDGLFTPVVRHAEEKTLSAISSEMKELAGRARQRKLKPEEYQGGVTAISNLGMYGIRDFTAIINPPHATILAIGASEKRAVVKDDAVAIQTMMSATLACDHRVLDGALGAELLGAFKRFVEHPMSMLV